MKRTDGEQFGYYMSTKSFGVWVGRLGNLICGQMICESMNKNYSSGHRRTKKRESWGELN